MTSPTFLSVLSRTRSLKLLYEFLLRNTLSLALSRRELCNTDSRMHGCTLHRVPTNKENRRFLARCAFSRSPRCCFSTSSRISTISTDFYAFVSRDGVLSWIFLQDSGKVQSIRTLVYMFHECVVFVAVWEKFESNGFEGIWKHSKD